MRPNAKRRNATRQQNAWAQLGMGAGALLLPPLALGAAFYAMLASPDDNAPRPAKAVSDVRQAAPPLPPPITIARAPDAVQPAPGDGTRGPLRIAVTAADGSAAPPPADPPKRAPRRHAQRPPRQDPFPLRTWLEDIGKDIGILPRNNNSNNTRGG